MGEGRTRERKLSEGEPSAEFGRIEQRSNFRISDSERVRHYTVPVGWKAGFLQPIKHRDTQRERKDKSYDPSQQLR